MPAVGKNIPLQQDWKQISGRWALDAVRAVAGIRVSRHEGTWPGGGDGSGTRIQRLNKPGQRVWRQPVVGIQEQQRVACWKLHHAPVARRRDAGIVLTDQAKTRVTAAGDECGSVVRGTIVDDHRRPVLMRLRQDRSDAILDPSGGVIGCDNNADMQDGSRGLELHPALFVGKNFNPSLNRDVF